MPNKVQFIKEVDCKKGKTILEIANKENIKIKAPCNGKGKCGKCIVKVKGDLEEPTKQEIDTLGEKKIEKGYRLACQAKVKGDVKIIM